MHQERQTTTLTETEATRLETAIAQAVTQSQQTAAAAATAAALAQQQAQQQAIARFQLPFDDATTAVLPALGFRFGRDDTNPIAWFHYKDLVIEVREKWEATHTHCKTWVYLAKRQGVEVAQVDVHVYPNSSWGGYSTPEEIGRDFLVWLHEAAHTPTPTAATQKTETFLDPIIRREQRERFLEAALQGALVGLISTSLETGVCLQDALFALETAEQTIMLMDTTPLQRQVLRVLSLEHFTDWVRACPEAAIVGSLAQNDHPVCRYLKEKGLELSVSNLALYAEDGTCILGNDGTAPIPNELPLGIVGEWLPELLDWKTFDPDTQTDYPTFTAGEVLSFLKPFQR